MTPMTATRTLPTWINLPDTAFHPCEYHAGHQCRKCYVSMTDMEVIEAGLFIDLCPRCLASARQSRRVSALVNA